jgi:hypothetical protein
LFSGSAAVLFLLNIGPTVTVGLPPYTLQQDMNVSLGGGGLSVGARLGGVALLDAPMGGLARMNSESDSTDAPEPSSGVLLLGGGALLYALARLRKSKLARGAEGTHAGLLK